MVSRLLSSLPVAIAHRGGAKLRPENTLVAFGHAVALGVDAIECDVHLSRDGEPVVIHDATLDRTTDATGPVAARTADELAGVDAGFHFAPEQGFPFRGRALGVPRLSDVLSSFPDVPVVIEIKGADPRTADRVLALVEAHRAQTRVVIAGFSDRVLASVRRHDTSIVTSASQGEVQAALRRAYFWLAPRQTGCRLFQIPVRLRGRTVLTRSFVRALCRARFPVHAWIVDEVDEMQRLLEWGVTGLISDRPDRAVSVVGALRDAAVAAP